MKRKLLVAFSILCGVGFAQNINFENWSTTANSQDSLNNWSSTNHAVNMLTSTITTLFKSNDAAAGNHAAYIQTAPFGFAGSPTVGIMVNGEARFSFNGTTTKHESGGGTPFGLKPPALNGKYKINGMYPGLIQVLLTEYNASTQKRDTIGFGSLQLSASNNIYTSFSVPISYQSLNMPDTLTIIAYASDPSSVPSVNSSFSSLYLDDFWFFPNFVNDIGIQSIKSPTGSSPVNSPDTVSAWIVNYGSTMHTGFDVSYTENGLNKVQESFNDTLYANDSVLFKFSQLFVPKNPGNDTICVFLENVLNDGNSSNDTACVTAANSLSTAEVDVHNLNIYPNPNSGTFKISTLKPIHARLYNSAGQEVANLHLRTGENKVTLSHLPKGLYILRSSEKAWRVIISK
ncbi:MAG: T9SS type A sorting domain-containing protein [Schleiferiaceae bacterium]|jgi:hypothetical protein|nr:T9SS type A sorting domain-containing protein [Schleiferiaceae bacterium]